MNFDSRYETENLGRISEPPSIISTLRTLSVGLNIDTDTMKSNGNQVPGSILAKFPDFDTILKLAIDEIWQIFDENGDGVLDREETRAFVDYSMNS